MSKTRAILDIGSNTVRLVIFAGPPRAPLAIFNEKVTAKLGKGVAENGRLSSKSMASALAGLARFAAILRLKQVDEVTAVATAATRDASNGEAFLEQVRALGLNPRLLGGEEEAATSAMGVIAAFPKARGVVADLGGGSLELIHVADGEPGPGISLPFGTLRLPDLRAEGAARLKEAVARSLHVADWSPGNSEPLYLVGGAHRAFARYAMSKVDWPLDDVHGFELGPDEALKLCTGLMRGRLAPEAPGLSSSRAAALPDAAALLAELVRGLDPSKLVFSSWGLREGLLYQHLPREVQAQDPLLAGVAVFTQSSGGSPSNAAMVAGWTTPALAGGAGGQEPLRLAATMLALAAAHLEPNLRADESLDWALRKRWTGIDAQGRAMLAAALIANAGRAAIPGGLERLASRAALEEAMSWGAAIRLCRRFTALASPALSHSALSVEEGKLILSVEPEYRALCTDQLDKDLRVLAERLGREPCLKIG